MAHIEERDGKKFVVEPEGEWEYTAPTIEEKKPSELELTQQRVNDLELALAEQVVANAELQQRQQDTELMLADILTSQTGV